MALKGLKVIELAGLAPAPFCGMLLADFGSTVIRVDRVSGNIDLDSLKNGKKLVALNLKHKKGSEILKKLSEEADVLIEPFRKGVMENLGLGPDVLMKKNPKLIYARLTGFGQDGQYAERAGHDINYVALSGVLSLLGRKNEKPTPPINLLADFAGGGLMCAFGILVALHERSKSGKGQVIDAAMTDGCAYLSSWIFRSQNLPIWGNSRGNNILDTGSHFYETYKTKDNKYIAVGALESQFYRKLVEKLGNNQLDEQYSNFDAKKDLLTKIFSGKTRDEWCAIFDNEDACLTPVLDASEVAEHPYHKTRDNFTVLESGLTAPKPAPKLSRTPGLSTAPLPEKENGEDTQDVLLELGYTEKEIKDLHNEKVIKVVQRKAKL